MRLPDALFTHLRTGSTFRYFRGAKGDSTLIVAIGSQVVNLLLGDCSCFWLALERGYEYKNTSATARVKRPHRSQVEMQLFSLDQMLPADHQARLVWQSVQSLNLEPLYAKIEVGPHQAGRDAIAPKLLVALWLPATLEGIGSARELARRCQRDIPYLWLRGHRRQLPPHLK